MRESPQTRDRCTVLIGIVTKDRADILPRSVESALSQRMSVRIAVIDDGSRDLTAEVMQRFPAVEWITWPESRGYVAARNYWITNADTEYFVGLDDDAWFLQGNEVGEALSVMEGNPRTGAIAFDILSPDRPTPQLRKDIKRVSSFIGCGHMLRLSAVREIGGYEENPGRYGGEEKDLSLRLLDAGYEIVRLNGVHVWHDKTTLAREIPTQHSSGVCNDMVMTVRRTPLYLLPLAIASKFYRHLIFGLRNGLLSPSLRGFSLFLKSIPAVWKSRKPVKTSTLRTFMQLRSQ